MAICRIRLVSRPHSPVEPIREDRMIVAPTASFDVHPNTNTLLSLRLSSHALCSSRPREIIDWAYSLQHMQRPHRG